MYSVHSYTRHNLLHCTLYTAVPGTISCTGLCSQLYQVGFTALYSVHSYTRYNVLHCALYTVVPGTMYCKFLCKQLYQVQCTALYNVLHCTLYTPMHWLAHRLGSGVLRQLEVGGLGQYTTLYRGQYRLQYCIVADLLGSGRGSRRLQAGFLTSAADWRLATGDWCY